MKRILILVVVLIMAALAGCGDGNNAGGAGTGINATVQLPQRLSLSLTQQDLGNGLMEILAEATYTPVDGSSPEGTAIAFGMHQDVAPPNVKAYAADASGVVKTLFMVARTSTTQTITITAGDPVSEVSQTLTIAPAVNIQ